MFELALVIIPQPYGRIIIVFENAARTGFFSSLSLSLSDSLLKSLSLRSKVLSSLLFPSLVFAPLSLWSVSVSLRLSVSVCVVDRSRLIDLVVLSLRNYSSSRFPPLSNSPPSQSL